MKIIEVIKRMVVRESRCAGCGSPLVEWTEERVRQGYREQRRWRGCPVYRDLDRASPRLWAELDRHLAYWTSEGRTRLADE